MGQIVPKYAKNNETGNSDSLGTKKDYRLAYCKNVLGLRRYGFLKKKSLRRGYPPPKKIACGATVQGRLTPKSFKAK